MKHISLYSLLFSASIVISSCGIFNRTTDNSTIISKEVYHEEDRTFTVVQPNEETKSTKNKKKNTQSETKSIKKETIISSNVLNGKWIIYSAKDKATGKEQSIRIEASSGLSDAEIKRMKDEAAANAAADQLEKEKVDTINKADSMIFQTEKQLKEFGDKLPTDKKAPIESALQELKEAHKAQDVTRINSAIEKLNNVFQAASQEMYNAQQNAQQGPQGNPNAGQTNNNGKDQEVTDVDFEEVK